MSAHPATLETKRKMLIFNASLPRSGGTILQLFLSQHPQIFASLQSPLVDLVHGVTTLYEGTFHQDAAADSLAKRSYKGAVAGMLEHFYDFTDRPVTVDKGGSGALLYADLFSAVLERVDIIFCIRDPRGIIASLERDCRKGVLHPNELPPALANAPLMERIKWWIYKGPLATGLKRLGIALASKTPKRTMHVLRYEDLCLIPKATVELLYDDFGITPHGQEYAAVPAADPQFCFAKPPNGFGVPLRPPREDWQEVLGTEASDFIVLQFRNFYRDFYPEVFSMNPYLLVPEPPHG